MLDLAIIIVSYNTRYLTGNCLSSVLAALDRSSLEAEIWVVDNASQDGSAEYVQKKFPQVKLIANDENIGFAAATNLALTHIGELSRPPRYVFLLNPDTLVEQDALSTLVEFLDTHPEVGVVGPQLAYANGTFQHSAFRFPTLLMTFFDFWPVHHRLLDSRLNGRYPRCRYARGEPFPIDHPLGAALMVRWETIQQAGPLDTGYFMYCEEVDWCMRIKALGWQVYCVPQARILHLAGQSTRQFRDKMFVALWRSRFRLFRQHYSHLYQTLARLIVQAGVRREIARTRQAQRRGEISAQEASQRLAAFRQVLRM